VYLVRSSDIMYQLLNCGPAAAPSGNWYFVGSKLMFFLYSPSLKKERSAKGIQIMMLIWGLLYNWGGYVGGFCSVSAFCSACRTSTSYSITSAKVSKGKCEETSPS
jgi:hypothetical protein